MKHALIALALVGLVDSIAVSFENKKKYGHVVIEVCFSHFNNTLAFIAVHGCYTLAYFLRT
jgi:hypothetical protein